MVNIITALDTQTCPNLGNFKLGTYLQSIYTALQTGPSGTATNLTAMQSCRALVNEMRAAWSTNYATLTSARTLANENKTVTNTIKTLVNETKTVGNTIKTLVNETKTVGNTNKTLSNEIKTVANTNKTLSNEIKTVANTNKTLSNEMRTKYETNRITFASIGTIITEIKSKQATDTLSLASLVTLGKELRADSTTNAAAVTNLKKWFLNQSYGKARLKIGAASSAAVQVAATCVNGTINGVWYSCVGAEAAFATPTDSFASEAATRVSRCYTFYYTSFSTLTHSVGATIAGTAVAPVIPRVASNAFPLGVCKIVLAAGSGPLTLRFNGGTTTLGAAGLTTTFTDYSVLTGYLGDYAPAVAAGDPSSAAAAITHAYSTPATAVTAAAITAIVSASVTAIVSASVTAIVSASVTAIVSASVTAVVSAAVSYPAPSTISAAMSTPAATDTIGTVASLNIDESSISW